jgi:hypothetical protein
MPEGKLSLPLYPKKTVTDEWHYLEIFYSKQHPIQPRNMEKATKKFIYSLKYNYH